MQGQSFLLLLAGYETTSSALGFAAHELSIHQDIQKKLQDEIDEYFPDGVSKTVKENEYLKCKHLRHISISGK